MTPTLECRLSPSEGFVNDSPMSLFTDAGMSLSPYVSASVEQVFAESTSLLRSMWPPSLPQYQKELVSLEAVTSPHQVVPSSIEALGQWCYVEKDGGVRDVTRNQYLAYRNDDPECHETSELVLTFQGSVHALELSQYGNWTGYVTVYLVAPALLCSNDLI